MKEGRDANACSFLRLVSMYPNWEVPSRSQHHWHICIVDHLSIQSLKRSIIYRGMLKAAMIVIILNVLTNLLITIFVFDLFVRGSAFTTVSDPICKVTSLGFEVSVSCFLATDRMTALPLHSRKMHRCKLSIQ